MQAIGSLANLVQIVVASSHVQALGARRSPQSATVSLDNRSHLPYLQIIDYNNWMLLFVTMQAAICSTCRYLIRILLHKRQP